MSEESNGGGKLAEIIAEFADLDNRERLEMLLDYADHLPPLPPRYQELRDRGENRVHECMTPVWLWVELEHGRVQIHAEVAPEAPTVKGFVAILVEAFAGASPQEVLAIPSNLLARLGLQQALGMNRMRGLTAIVQRIRKGVESAAG
jgi:cysteine desulfuration protein SufE